MEFLTLPNEILCDILKLLDWECLLAIKLTCRHLREVLKSPILWIYKAAQLSLKSDLPVFQGPMESYSIEELEQKVVRRLQIHDRWRGPLAFRLRELDGVRCKIRGSFHLLPGGRWLLSNIDGRIYVLDLDKPKQPRHLIFERPSTDTGDVLGPLTRFSIWVDSSKPWVSVRMALFNRGLVARSGNTGTRICIYQLDFNAREVNPTWTVKPIVTLMTCGSDHHKRVGLEEDYVIERCIHRRGHLAWRVHVSRYSEPGPPRVFDCECPHFAQMTLLPADRLIKLTGDLEPYAEIFNIKISNEPHSLVLEPSLRISLDFNPLLPTEQRVHVTVGRHWTYIVGTSGDRVQALQIPNEAGRASPIVKRFSLQYSDNQNQPTEILLGSSVAVVLRMPKGRECWMDVITYDLQGDTEEVHVESHTSQQIFHSFGWGASSLITCDEDSGRIIFYYGGTYWLLTV